MRGIPESALYGDVNVGAVSEAPLCSIGDITITQSRVITPAGTFPVRGSVWTVTDMSRTEEYMPTYAVVLAIIFFVFCLLGLLFLLMKATKTVGFVQVTVNSGSGFYHSTMIPVATAQTTRNCALTCFSQRTRWSSANKPLWTRRRRTPHRPLARRGIGTVPPDLVAWWSSY